MSVRIVRANDDTAVPPAKKQRVRGDQNEQPQQGYYSDAGDGYEADDGENVFGQPLADDIPEDTAPHEWTPFSEGNYGGNDDDASTTVPLVPPSLLQACSKHTSLPAVHVFLCALRCDTSSMGRWIPRTANNCGPSPDLEDLMVLLQRCMVRIHANQLADPLLTSVLFPTYASLWYKAIKPLWDRMDVLLPPRTAGDLLGCWISAVMQSVDAIEAPSSCAPDPIYSRVLELETQLAGMWPVSSSESS